MKLIELIAKDRDNYQNILLSQSHAIIIENQDNVLLETFAKYFVCNLFCKNEVPCLKCGDCLKVINNNSLDFFMFSKPLMVDDAKEIMDNLYVVPAENDYKVFVISNFEKISERVQNKLLKSIEEPPRFVKFLLLTTNISAILPTVRSRCEKFELSNFTKQELMQFIDFDDENLKRVAIENSFCNYGNVVNYLKNKDFENIVNLVFDMLQNMKMSSDALKYYSLIIKYKENILLFVKILQNVVFDILKYHKGTNGLIDNQSHLKDIENLSQLYSNLACVKIIEYLDNINENLQFNANLNLQIDTMLLYILEVKYKCKK